MPELFQRLLQLLNKTDDVLAQFIEELGEKPSFDNESEHSRSVMFANHGITLDFDKPSGFCSSIAFHISTGMVEAGNMSPYAADFPSGIRTADSRWKVEQKLGFPPVRTDLPGAGSGPGSHCEDYSMSAYSLTFIFDKITGAMSLMTVSSLVPHAQDGAMDFFPSFEGAAEL